MDNYVVGIDFGTSNCCLSYCNKDGDVKIILNECGGFITPSVMYFNDTGEIEYGMLARDISFTSIDKTNLISNLKRLVGTTNYTDLMRLNFIDLFKSNKILKSGDTYHFEINECKYSVSDLIQLYMKYLKRLIVDSLGKEFIGKVVITVPAYFNDNQRDFIKKCGEHVGFEVIRIINEPTAAALAYGYLKQKSNPEYIVVFDCGGGTTDLSLLYMDYNEKVYEVKSVIGDNILGGEDVTTHLYNHVLQKYPGFPQGISPGISNKIRKECEKVKCELSFKENSTVFIEGDVPFLLNINRNKFIDFCEPFFKKINHLIDLLLKNANINVELINNVVFVGGSSRIPHFETIFKKYLGNDVIINNEQNPDQIVGIGAGIQGYLLNNPEKDDTLLLDVVPMSLGVELLGGIMGVIVPKNTTIPVLRTREFTNSGNGEDIIEISIYQGDRVFVKDNLLLLKFEVSDSVLGNYKKGEIIVKISFDIDCNGMISVNAEFDMGNGEMKICKVKKIMYESVSCSEYLDFECNIRDIELSNKIIIKLELYDLFKHLLKVFLEHKEQVFKKKGKEDYLTMELNKLFDETFKIITNYEDYSVEYLKNTKDTFQKKWHELIFMIDPIFKDSDGNFIEMGGTDIE